MVRDPKRVDAITRPDQFEFPASMVGDPKRVDIITRPEQFEFSARRGGGRIIIISRQEGWG
jgi:hypothetical protein